MRFKLLTEQHFGFLILKRYYTGSSESIYAKMPKLLEITCHGSNYICFLPVFGFVLFGAYRQTFVG